MIERALIALSLLTTLASMFAPPILLAAGHERREGFWWRVLGIIAAGVVLVTVIATGQDASLGGLADPTTAVAPILTVLATYLVLLPCAVLLLFRVPVWDALFFSALGYTMQNLASSLAEVTLLLMYPLGRAGSTPVANLLVNLVWYAVVYAVCYVLLIRPMQRVDGLCPSRSILAASLLVLLIVIYFDMMLKGLVTDGAPVPRILRLRAVHVAACVLVLMTIFELVYRQKMRRDVEVERALRAEEEHRWELTQQNVDAIKVKCHDIRHQIRALAGTGTTVDASLLDGIAREVQVYDSLVHTGNAALDTVLDEKRLVCDAEGIELTVMADGRALDALAPAEVYALVGGALDAAVEEARALADPGAGGISLVVREVAGMASVHVEGSCAEKGERIAGGGGGGFGGGSSGAGGDVPQVRAVCERHGGTLTCSRSGGLLELDALLAC